MRIYLDDSERERCEKSDSIVSKLLLDDDWRPLSEYVYDRKYVYAVTINHMLRPNVAIARGGKYESSQWWTPGNKNEPVLGMAGLSVTHWKPLPEGIDAYNPLPHWEQLMGYAWVDPNVRVREPEPVYEPAPPTAKLTPGPRDLLVAMRDGAVLRERGREWASFTLTKPGGAPAKITYRPIKPLIHSAFIVLDGVLPPRTDRWYDLPWKITDAGLAWLAANVGPR